MNNLNNDQLLKKVIHNKKYRGRRAFVRNPYSSKDLKHNDEVDIYGVEDSGNLCKVERLKDGTVHLCYTDELNFIDKEFSGLNLYLKKVREERKDKYGNKFMIELLPDNKSIQISESTISLLLLDKEKAFVSFAFDPDSKKHYIYNAKNELNGYKINPKNNRIVSTADYRELNLFFNTNLLTIKYDGYIDVENYPDVIFFEIYKEEEFKKIPKLDFEKYIHQNLKSTFYDTGFIQNTGEITINKTVTLNDLSG